MNNRDMFYNSYGFQGTIPMNPMMPQYNQQYNPGYNIGYNSQYNNYNPISDIDNRITKIEKQINRLNQRVTRLESPNSTNIYNEPDSTLYML